MNPSREVLPRTRLHGPTRAAWVLTVLVVAGWLVACSEDPPADPSPPARSGKSPAAGCGPEAGKTAQGCLPIRRDSIRRDPIALLFLEGTTLVTQDLAGSAREFTDLDTADVFASASGRHVAYVTGSPSTLNLFTPATDSRVELGPGTGPVWSATGDRLAWIRSSEACEGETCVPEGEVVAQEVGAGPERVLLPEGSWGILGWAGDALHVFNTDAPEHVLAVKWAEPGETLDLPIPVSEYWEAAPDGSWLLRVDGEVAEFLEIAAIPPSGGTMESIAISLRGRLADGAWAPDSSAIAGVLLGRNDSNVIILEPGGDPKPLSGSGGAAGNLIWSADSSALAFARTDPEDKGKLQAVYCEGATLRCRPLFSWRRGVRLLGFR